MDEVKHGKETVYGTGKRLNPGDVVEFQGRKLVVRVNESRAVLVSVVKRAVKFTDSGSGKTIGFESAGTELTSISPNSLIPIVDRLGQRGVDHWNRHRELLTH